MSQQGRYADDIIDAIEALDAAKGNLETALKATGQETRRDVGTRQTEAAANNDH